MSLDVSPDGQTIVFDLLGDLYTIPIVGGEATRLTSGTSLSRQPRYSPDGRKLAFVSDRSGSENLWIADRYGRHARQLSHLSLASGIGAVTSPAWSPDGRTIIVSQRLDATRPGSGSEAASWLLASYDVATGHMRWVSDTAPDRARTTLGATFAPDGRIYAAVDVYRREPWTDPAWWRVSRIDPTTGRVEPEVGASVSIGAPATLRPVISLDGRWMAYAMPSGSRLGLRLRDLHASHDRWLVREVLDNPQFHLGEPRDLVAGYAFTPDSKALIAAYAGQIHRIDLATGHGSVIPFEAEVERGVGPLVVHQFTLPDTAVRTRSAMQPALSPTGRRVAFSALDKIWVMELSDSGQPARQPYRATADSGVGEFYPSWSPDERWLAYSAWVDGEGGAIRRVRLGSNESARPLLSEQLSVDTAAYFHTAVAPDGEQIVAVRAAASPERVLSALRLEPGDFQLVSFRIRDGGRPRPLGSLATEFSASYRYPVDQMYLTADPSRVHVGLKSWSWEGKPSGQLNVATLGVTGGGLSDPDVAGVLSPDRCRALIAWNYALFELQLPACGGKDRDTLSLELARTQSFGAAVGAAHRWGTALDPWISWSRDGRRVLFGQGGTFFIGNVQPHSWTTFERVDVPLTVPVDIPHGTLALRGARIITMRRHEVIERGDVVVRNNRIVAVGPTGHVTIPSGARVLELRGATILPGYVDIHDHAWLEMGLHPQQWWGGLVRLAYGVTAHREATSGWGPDVFTFRERERTGDLIHPRIFSTGLPYYSTSPPIRTAADARERVQANADYFGSETFKIYFDLSTDRRARQLLAIAATGQQLNATAHTNGIELQLASVIDGLSGIEHPPGIAIYDDVTTFLARSGVTQTHTYFLIPGALSYIVRHRGDASARVKMRRFIPPSAQAVVCARCTAVEDVPAYGPAELSYLLPSISGAARIVTKGGRVAIGAHGEVPGIGFHYEMWLHAIGGMPQHEILRSATIIGATAIGHASDLGSLEPGKLADLQVLDKNPLEDIHHTTSLRYVMKNGRLYQADDLTEIWPRRRPLGTIYLWDKTPVTESPGADRRGR